MICMDCPRECRVDRDVQKGLCGGGALPKVARAALHFWEEPVISGDRGSGAVFFSGCALRCIYCQNRSIAHGLTGVTVSIERLAQIFIELQGQGAHNINLVTPSHEVNHIIEALIIAKRNGLLIPIVYNTSAYEKVETLRKLEGLVDIWLPDMKYFSPQLSERYSAATDYFSVASKAIAEMFRQAGTPVFETVYPGNTRSRSVGIKDKTKAEAEVTLMKRGVIVRHLVLPAQTNDSKKVIEYLYETYGNQIYLSIMNQFTPYRDETKSIQKQFPELTRKVSRREYERVVDYAIDIGVENAFIQEGETSDESFIPEFDGTGAVTVEQPENMTKNNLTIEHTFNYNK